jgi:hypothetical protein
MSCLKIAITGHKIHNQTDSSYEANLSVADVVFYAYVSDFDEASKLFKAVQPNLKDNRTHAWLLQSEKAERVHCAPKPIIKQIAELDHFVSSV